MEIIFVKDYKEMSEKGYEVVKKTIETKESPVISLITGSTPQGLFKLLVEGINSGLDISNTVMMSLDEYIGPRDAVYTARTYIYKNLLEQIGSKPKNLFLVDGDAENKEEEIGRFKKIVNEYPRDVQVLGLGTNAHIAANEPGTPFNSSMFVAKFEESTIKSTMESYGLERIDTPTEMITGGFIEILSAKRILLLVSGRHKAQAVKDLIEGNITPECPASILKACDNVTVIIDEDAASLLEIKA